MIRRVDRRGLLAAAVAGVGALAGCSLLPRNEAVTEEPETETVAGTYGVVVDNEIDRETLERAEIGEGTTVSADVEVARSVDGAEDPVLFERSLDLGPGESRRFEDAVTVEREETYVVLVELTPLYEYDGRAPDLGTQYRFRPGEFNTPDGSTIRVSIDNGGNEVLVRPRATVE